MATTSSLQQLQRTVCWKRTTIVLVTVVVSAMILTYSPPHRRELEESWSATGRARSLHPRKRRDPVPAGKPTNRRVLSLFSEGPPLALDAAEAEDDLARFAGRLHRRSEFTDSERAVVKKYRCRFVDGWPASRTHPEPLAIFSILASSDKNGSLEKYLQHLEVLGYSLKRHAPDLPHYVMLVEGTECESLCQSRIHDSGWRICRAPRLEPALTSPDAVRQLLLTKLVLWNVVQFERIIYLDSDTFALGRLDQLRNMPVSKDSPLAALAIPTEEGQPLQLGELDLSVAVIRTGAKEFLRLFTLLRDRAFTYDPMKGEQSFLGKVYASSYLKIDIKDNTNALESDPHVRDGNGVRILHFPKGGGREKQSGSSPFRNVWRETREEMCLGRCRIPESCWLAQAADCACPVSSNCRTLRRR